MDPKQLREETRVEHEATEALLPVGHAALNAAEYAAALQALKPIVMSWESWAEQAAPEDLRSLVVARKRSAWLAADLAWLAEQGEGTVNPETDPGRPERGVNWAEVVKDGESRPGEDEVPGEEISRAAFLGVMYVMEGSTLGGRFVVKHVVATLGEAFEPATQYFGGHGDRTGSMWREVTAAISAIPQRQADWTVAVAKRAFQAFGVALRSGFEANRLPAVQTQIPERASKVL